MAPAPRPVPADGASANTAPGPAARTPPRRGNSVAKTTGPGDGYWGSRSMIQVHSSSVIRVCPSFCEAHRKSSRSLSSGESELMSA